MDDANLKVERKILIDAYQNARPSLDGCFIRGHSAFYPMKSPFSPSISGKIVIVSMFNC